MLSEKEKNRTVAREKIELRKMQKEMQLLLSELVLRVNRQGYGKCIEKS